MKVIYLYAQDVFKDDNDGFKFGVEGVTQNGISQSDYIEWFKTIQKLEANSEKNNLEVINKVEFFNYMQEIGALK